MAKAGDDWSVEEIDICVSAYADAVRAGGTKKNISKDIYLYRAIKQLPGRNEGSVGRRMANISHIMAENGANHVLGWKPLPNVGPTNTLRIRDALIRRGVLADI
jgi:hypothetical protein